MKPTGCLHVAAIVLAAGAATRMGSLKQLLPYRGRTLLHHAIDQAMEAGLGPIVVVVGAEADRVQAAIAARPVDIARNANWQLGMGASLTAGIQKLQEVAGHSAAVAVLLADQPLITSEHLSAMRTALYTGHTPIVAAQYNHTLGVPALFKREVFAALAALPPESGARHLLRDERFPVTPFPLPEAALDLDTPADLAELEARH